MEYLGEEQQSSNSIYEKYLSRGITKLINFGDSVGGCDALKVEEVLHYGTTSTVCICTCNDEEDTCKLSTTYYGPFSWRRCLSHKLKENNTNIKYKKEKHRSKGFPPLKFVAKILHKDRLFSRPLLQRARFEIKVLSELWHPNILPLLLAGEATHELWMLFDVSKYGDLSTYCCFRNFTEGDVWLICYQLLHALDYIHRRGIVHCDVKPENILLFDGAPGGASFECGGAMYYGDTLDGGIYEDVSCMNTSDSDVTPSTFEVNDMRVRSDGGYDERLVMGEDGDSRYDSYVNRSMSSVEGLGVSSYDSDEVEMSIAHREEEVKVCGSGGVEYKRMYTQPEEQSHSMSAHASFDRGHVGCESESCVMNMQMRRSNTVDGFDKLKAQADRESREELMSTMRPKMPSLHQLNLKLCDFGFAQCYNEHKSIVWKGVQGSYGYIAPEVLQGIDYDDKVDLWALGVIAFELLGGYSPFYPASNCIKEVVEFDMRYWCEISDVCINFIRGLLRLDASHRMSAKNALAHPWMKRQHLSKRR